MKYSKRNILEEVFVVLCLSKQFIINNDLRFSEDLKNGEDFLFITMSFLHADSVSHLDLDFYNVALREDSASRIWNYNKVKDMLNWSKSNK